MSTNKNRWTQEEDDIIQRFVLDQGQQKWTKIAKAIKTELGIDDRTGKQCRERWHNHLSPDVKKETWTGEEERKIFELQKQMGNKWSEIASQIPGRTDNAVKNCFYSAIRRNLRRFNKGRTESEKLKGSLKQLLKRPSARAILMESYVKNEGEVNEVIKPIIFNKVKKEEPNDIVVPSFSPIGNFGCFSFPITPSTTQSILSSKYGPSFFDFSDQVDKLGLGTRNGFVSIELDPLPDQSNPETPLPYFFPPFSPAPTPGTTHLQKPPFPNR